jgi:hypothetical protein
MSYYSTHDLDAQGEKARSCPACGAISRSRLTLHSNLPEDSVAVAARVNETFNKVVIRLVPVGYELVIGQKEVGCICNSIKSIKCFSLILA